MRVRRDSPTADSLSALFHGENTPTLLRSVPPLFLAAPGFFARRFRCSSAEAPIYPRNPLFLIVSPSAPI